MRLLFSRHPYMVAFVLLAAVMEVVLFFATRSVALVASQYATIATAVVLLAALCVWIIRWE